jgi:hypothetical protein
VEGEGKEKSKLENYAEHLVDELSKSISDKDRELTGIPLQTRMLAEAFDEEVRIFYESAESMPELPSKLDLLGLYERFIDRKYDIYQEEKVKVSVNNVAAKEQRNHHLKIITEDHQLLALKVLFNEEQVALFENNRKCSFSAEELTRIGIVQISSDGKLQFIHRTFAEYYVAICLVNSLTKGNNSAEQVQTFILKDIFLDTDYEMVRVFVDGFLSRSEISKELLKQYGNQIHELRKYDDLILHRAAFEGNVNIIGFLLDSVLAGDHRDTVNEMLLGRDKEGLTAWNIAVLFNNTQVLEKVWEYAEKNLMADELESKLFARDCNGRNAWHWTAELVRLKVLLKQWECAKRKLTTEEINNEILLATDNDGKTVWNMAAGRENGDLLQELWVWAKEALTAEEIKN